MKKSGITLVELIVVSVISAMLVAVGVVSFSMVDSRRLQSATNMLLADIWWARQMAVASDNDYEVRFDIAQDRYCICNDSLNACAFTGCDIRDASNFAKPMVNWNIDITAAPSSLLFEAPAGSIDSNLSSDVITLTKVGRSRQLNIVYETGYVGE